jgi:hypothetical protein
MSVPRTAVFAGQRADGFYVDLGSIFDLGDLASYVAKPELAALLPSLCPGVFPNLDALSKRA